MTKLPKIRRRILELGLFGKGVKRRRRKAREAAFLEGQIKNIAKSAN